jgi:hypothetical protein
MNELELKRNWQNTNDKFEECFAINRTVTDDIMQKKVHSILGSMKPLKIFTVLVGLLWVGIGLILLISIYKNAFSDANKFFLFSATVQVLLTAISLIIYLYQLTKIYQVETYAPIIQTQKKLAQLKVSTLWVTRIMFLQLPVWTIFWWNDSMLVNWSIIQWIIPIFITGSFALIALWLFFNIKYENRNKKWFQLIFSGKEWAPIMKSMELLDQVDDYKADTGIST